MIHGAALALVGLLLLAGMPGGPAAQAQDSVVTLAPVEAAPAASSVAPAPKPRPRPRPRPQAAAPPPGPEPAELATRQRPERSGFEPAPVPNRDMELPNRLADRSRQDQPSLSPSILYRNLPTPNRAGEGAVNHTEERLFTPGPGARLTVPFSY